MQEIKKLQARLRALSEQAHELRQDMERALSEDETMDSVTSNKLVNASAQLEVLASMDCELLPTGPQCPSCSTPMELVQMYGRHVCFNSPACPESIPF